MAEVHRLSESHDNLGESETSTDETHGVIGLQSPQGQDTALATPNGIREKMTKTCPRHWIRPEASCWRFSGSRRQSVWQALTSVGLLAASACDGGIEGPGFAGVDPSATAPTATPSQDAMLYPEATTNPSGTAPPGVGSEPTVGPTVPEVPDMMGPDAGAGGSGGNEGAGGAPVDPAIYDASPITTLRLLTQREYKNSVAQLLGGVDTTELKLPDDEPVAGFSTVGAAAVTVNETAGEAYEEAGRTLTLEVFSDAERWPALVGCEPQPDLSDSCVETYVRAFGRRAFRRELTEEEAQQWVDVARNAATLSEDAATGLATATWGILQSPNFLYRLEHAEPDLELGRIKFDAASMATRLAYLTTGTTPDEWLLDAAAAGELDTEEGIRSAATQLMAQEASGEFASEFFVELTEVWQVLRVERDPEVFPGVEELRASMLEEVRRWLGQVVLAPEADVRSFFDSNTTFVDDPLAEFYGLPSSGEGAQPGGGVPDFQEVQLSLDTGRAGILGKAAFLMSHSSPDSSNPTRRGKFILHQFNCLTVRPPPADLMVAIPKSPEGQGAKTTRQLFEEQHRVDPTCVTCHELMDPFGFALEHFDAVGRYRETENGLPINATGEFQGAAFDGAVELGTVLRDSDATLRCFVENLYRYGNGVVDGKADAALIEELVGSLADRNYVWRDMLIDFAASDAFTSLAPTTKAN